ncbi:DMT family transporter [Parasphingorhabdus cellanae]|uniref:EamA family transporter n=1 Tax=Parasphingorhabdus cellanae TaxID=2806553 RepID=A0ABX7T995_9SPHN|nr:DMT family transporter [Parasphingorhabdus cellanae]QTD57137.1 EamA family transporter [Parasphingorhabdus cellanae]
MLGLLLGFQHGRAVLPRGDTFVPAIALFVYAVSFSYAYVSLDAAIGALILFPAGQLSLQMIGIVRGIYPTPIQWAGLLLAIAGLVVFLAPGDTAPPLIGGLIMALAGISWGFYSWAGKGASRPALTTTRNFFGASLLCLLLIPFFGNADQIQPTGIALAVISGTVTSGLGYITWYAVLPRLSVSTAAASQLSVPAIAALGGVLLLGETLSTRFFVGSAMIFAGIGLTMFKWPGFRMPRQSL